MRVVIVGGGILGLATAREAQRADPEAVVTVLEKEPHVALHQSSHNSGVVHAGLYYVPGSLKARLCRRGVALLRDFCQSRGLPYEACGKLVVAVEPGELGRLHALGERAEANGVAGLRLLPAHELSRVEPYVRGLEALHSPETAIADFGAISRALAEEVTAGGGEVRTSAPVARVRREGGAVRVELTAGGVLAADRAIVCAGLHADRLARASGESADPRIVPFRGEYWKLDPAQNGLLRGLVYPVPDPALPFLGVHLTRKLDGSIWLGPNALLALAREGYSRRVLSPRDVLDSLRWPGTWRMMRRHWRVGAVELRRSLNRSLVLREARRYVPALGHAPLTPAPAGVRAQAIGLDGSLLDDFRLSDPGPVVWVRNAPSPGATSALSIAEELVARALG
jgi:L-2-hydroxyglutarate oxidase LhgO